MLADLWPQYALTIVTPRLQLRLPREEELAGLADVAGQGVHPRGERPFLTPWTDGAYADRARFVLQEHWHQLASWDVAGGGWGWECSARASRSALSRFAHGTSRWFGR
jgi:hypothetical protein